MRRKENQILPDNAAPWVCCYKTSGRQTLLSQGASTGKPQQEPTWDKSQCRKKESRAWTWWGGWRRKQKEKDFKPTRDKGSCGSTWRQLECPWMGHPEAKLTSNQQCLQDSSCIFSVGRYSRCAARPHFCYLLFEEVVFVGFFSFLLSVGLWSALPWDGSCW